MSEEKIDERERRRFIRLDLSDNVRAVDGNGRDIGRVEKVGAGGMQIRLTDGIAPEAYDPGVKMEICIVEPNNVRNEFQVAVRVREGQLLGVEFLN
jgi:hypothetical protein